MVTMTFVDIGPPVLSKRSNVFMAVETASYIKERLRIELTQ